MSLVKKKARTLDVQAGLAGGGGQATDLDGGDKLGVGAIQSFRELPDLAIKNILIHIRADAKENDFDEGLHFMKKKDEKRLDSVLSPVQKEILKCRLVSKIWNNTIEDTSKLMKKITFPVCNPQRFLNLEIVKNRKIRSIKLTNAWPLKSKDTKDLVEVFSNTVEKVHFAYKNEEGASKLECEFFELILSTCNKIEELIVTGSEGQMPSSGHVVGLFGRIKHTIKIAAANKIQYIMIDVTGITAYHVQGIINLLLNLPHLKEIKLIGTCTDPKVMWAVCNVLLEYLNKFKDGLQLKKLGLPTSDYYFDRETNKALNKLLIFCGKSEIAFDGLPELDLHSLLDYLKQSGATSDQRPLFIGEVDADLAFWGENLHSFEVLGELDIRYLRISYYNQSLLPGKLSWVGNLRCLQALALCGLGRRNANIQLAVDEIENCLFVGLHTVKSLLLRDHKFGLTRVIRWEQDFPNLKGLSITCCKNTPNDIIGHLTILESLSSLQFVGLQDLVDTAFTADCTNRYSSDLSSLASAVPTAPAIACFKALTFLEIYCCGLLTDACVTNGIAKCGTLNELKISRCKEITLSCLDNLDCDVFYLSSSWEKTIVKGKKNVASCAFSEKTKALC